MQYSANEVFSRSYALMGEENMNNIRNSTAMVFGIGGVGGHAAETLVRAGIKKLIIVDKDSFVPSNINRQLFASYENINNPKVDVAKKRLEAISPFTEIIAIKAFYLPENSIEINGDIVLDCIDTISAKLHLTQVCAQNNIPLIACMGMGNRFNPTSICIDKLVNTSEDPLCKVMRRETKKRGMSNISVVYSKEKPKPINLSSQGKSTPASLPYVPCVAGIYMAYLACEALSKRIDISSLVPTIDKGVEI